MRELRQVREENRKLKQVVAELTLDKQILREALGRNGEPSASARGGALGARRLPREPAPSLPGLWRLTPAGLVPLGAAGGGAAAAAPARVGHDAHRVWLAAAPHHAQRDRLRINYKKLHRLYVDEGLQLKPRRRHLRRAATVRMHRPQVGAANERWAMDFMNDVRATGAKVRVLTLIDVFRRECLALRAAPRFTGADVAAVLAEVAEGRDGLQRVIQCDNGTEFTSTALDHWA